MNNSWIHSFVVIVVEHLFVGTYVRLILDSHSNICSILTYGVVYGIYNYMSDLTLKLYDRERREFRATYNRAIPFSVTVTTGDDTERFSIFWVAGEVQFVNTTITDSFRLFPYESLRSWLTGVGEPPESAPKATSFPLASESIFDWATKEKNIKTIINIEKNSVDYSEEMNEMSKISDFDAKNESLKELSFLPIMKEESKYNINSLDLFKDLL